MDAGGVLQGTIQGSVGCPTQATVPIAATWVGSEAILMVDETGRTWKRWFGPRGLPGDCIRSGALTGAPTVLNAAASDGGWLAAVPDSAGVGRLVRYGADGLVAWAVPGPQFVSDTARIRRAHLTSVAGGVVVADSQWPFTWVLFGAEGTASVVAAPTDLGSLVAARDLETWSALGVVDLGEGYAQTLAGPGARQRVIVLYTLSGRPVSATSIGGAPILLASDTQGRRVLGIRISRGSGRGELVEYSY